MRRPAPGLEPLELRIAPATIFAVDSSNNLLTFDSAAPGEILSNTPITGLAPTELITGIDFRPATGQLYLFGVTPGVGDDTGRLYILNRSTGFAFPAGVAFGPLAEDVNYGFDFNPVADRIRVVNSADQNLRINPNNGALVQFDTALSDAAAIETITAVAYDRNFEGGTATTLFGIDFSGDRLVRIGGADGSPSPNGGQVTPVGPLGVTTSSTQIGFDIDATGSAFASIPVGSVTGLYAINLATGAATLVGPIGDGTTTLRGFAVAPQFVKVINPTTATFTDSDGDLVTIKTTVGNLNFAGFNAASIEGGGLQLRGLDLTAGGGNFAKTNLTITARPQGGKGNGFTEIGFINLTGSDFGKVVVTGDLGAISAGDTNTAITSPSVAALIVHSLGAFGLETMPVGSLSLKSNFGGPLGKLVVKTDVVGVTLDVEGGGTPSNGGIRSIFVGGNLRGTADGGGAIDASGDIGSVKILGSIIGGDAVESGYLSAGGQIASISIGGSVIGGVFNNSGGISSNGAIGKVVVRGSLIGNSGSFSGAIFGLGAIGSVSIGGSMLGDSGFGSGALWSNTSLGLVKVGGDITGGSEFFSGSIRAGAAIGGVLVKGSLSATTSPTSGIFAETDLGIVSIGRDLGSATATVPVIISATGDIDPVTSAEALTIKGVTVRGSVINAQIVAGYVGGVGPTNPDVIIGAIKVGGNWSRSVVAAGVDPGNDIFADGDDVAVMDGTPTDNIVSRIASVKIKGWAAGTFVGSDGYGFVARQIGQLKIGVNTYPLTSGPSNDVTPLLIGLTGDLRVREV